MGSTRQRIPEANRGDAEVTAFASDGALGGANSFRFAAVALVCAAFTVLAIIRFRDIARWNMGLISIEEQRRQGALSGHQGGSNTAVRSVIRVTVANRVRDRVDRPRFVDGRIGVPYGYL